MAEHDASIRYQLTVKREIGEKINELASRMNLSQSKMVELLLDAAIEDNEWMIKLVTSRWAKIFADVLKPTGKGRKPQADGA